MNIGFDQALAAFQKARAFLKLHQGSAPPWSAFQRELAALGLNIEQQRAVLATLYDHERHAELNQPAIRILHAVEKDLLSTDGYGLIIESLRLGLLEIDHVESLLEELAGQESLPLSPASLERALARRWRYHLRKERVH